MFADLSSKNENYLFVAPKFRGVMTFTGNVIHNTHLFTNASQNARSEVFVGLPKKVGLPRKDG